MPSSLPASREIFIALKPLDFATTTLDVLIHELANHSSMANDLTPEHAAEMNRIASNIIRDMKEGKFDHLIKGAIWI